LKCDIIYRMRAIYEKFINDGDRYGIAEAEKHTVAGI
jgi:hypothetical protein